MEALAFLRGPAGYIALHKSTIVVGRSADCDISLDTKSISGHHAKILLEGPTNSAVIDLNSRNGTYINDIKIKNDSVPVYPGDTIRFGTDLPPFRLEFSIDKTLEPLATSEPSESTLHVHRTTLESPSTIKASPNAEEGRQEPSTWFSRDDIAPEDCPILNIAQQEYKAAVNAARVTGKEDDDLSELTIPSHCAVLEHSYSQPARSSDLTIFLQKVDDKLKVLLPSSRAASDLVADLLAEIHTVQCPESGLLESILRRLDSLLKTTIEGEHTSPGDKQAINKADASNAYTSSSLPQNSPPAFVSDNHAETISSLQHALSERDKYELQLLNRLTDYKIAVSLLKDDLFTYLQQRASTPDSIDRALSASFVELKLREHLLSEELQKLQNREEGHLSSAETIDLLNQRICNLLSENATLRKMVDEK